MTTSRLCKYHGRACQFPGACLNRAPRKYEGDGHLETIDPERLTIGCVVRHPHSNGALSSFSDTVVTGIYVAYSARRQKEDKKCDKEHFLSLEAAKSEARRDDWVYVKLARPMLYADNVFGSMPSWALKCEVYEVYAERFLAHYKVVVQSTGEYDTRNVKTPLRKWEVMRNGEKVYDDLSEDGAKATYKLHRQMAQGAFGHKVGGVVTLLCDGVVDEEYKGE
jgi:hypothetical protein